MPTSISTPQQDQFTQALQKNTEAMRSLHDLMQRNPRGEFKYGEANPNTPPWFKTCPRIVRVGHGVTGGFQQNQSLVVGSEDVLPLVMDAQCVPFCWTFRMLAYQNNTGDIRNNLMAVKLEFSSDKTFAAKVDTVYALFMPQPPQLLSANWATFQTVIVLNEKFYVRHRYCRASPGIVSSGSGNPSFVASSVWTQAGWSVTPLIGWVEGE